MFENQGITRREFIHNSALLTASAAIAQATHASSESFIQGADADVNKRPDLVFPYGAVYFRKSNPPAEDWARDHETAARVGMNIFRHWFMWSAIEVAPGKFDWADYDRMMDLAAKNSIKVVIAEQVTAAPEWAFRKFASSRFLASDGTVVNSIISESSATGGFPGLCLDNTDVRIARGDVSYRVCGTLPPSSRALWL